MKRQISEMTTSIVFFMVAVLSGVCMILSISLIEYCGAMMVIPAGLSVLTGAVSLFGSIVKAINADLKW